MADTQTCHVIKGLPLCPEPNADGRTCSKVGKCLGSTPTPVPAASERLDRFTDAIVEDILKARANIAALEATATDVAVNLSGPAPTTTGEIARLVIELSGAKMQPQYVEPEAGKVRLTSGGAWRIDHALAEKTIGWRPQVDMREGIRRLIVWRDAQGR